MSKHAAHLFVQVNVNVGMCRGPEGPYESTREGVGNYILPIPDALTEGARRAGVDLAKLTPEQFSAIFAPAADAFAEKVNALFASMPGAEMVRHDYAAMVMPGAERVN